MTLPRRLRAAIAPGLALAALFLACPAAGQAATLTFGSDLSAPANYAEAHGADSVFWSTALGNGANPAVPANGQVVTIRLKGTAISNPAGPAPLTEFHFQVLRPQADGSVRVMLTSQPFHIPAGGDPNQVSSYDPIELCVKAGDYVAFNDEGGYNPQSYPNGVPYQVFSRVPGSRTAFFTADNGTNNGAVFKPASENPGQELLMQMVMRSDNDASMGCGGQRSSTTGGGGQRGAKGFSGLLVGAQTVFIKKGIARVKVTCPAVATAACNGVLALSTRGRVPVPVRVLRKKLKLGRAKFAKLQPGTSRRIKIKVPKQGVRLVRRRGGIKAFATAVTSAGSGPALSTRRVVSLKLAKRSRRR